VVFDAQQPQKHFLCKVFHIRGGRAHASGEEAAQIAAMTLFNGREESALVISRQFASISHEPNTLERFVGCKGHWLVDESRIYIQFKCLQWHSIGHQ
jgi:hypothetical protein